MRPNFSRRSPELACCGLACTPCAASFARGSFSWLALCDGPSRTFEAELQHSDASIASQMRLKASLRPDLCRVLFAFDLRQLCQAGNAGKHSLKNEQVFDGQSNKRRRRRKQLAFVLFLFLCLLGRRLLLPFLRSICAFQLARALNCELRTSNFELQTAQKKNDEQKVLSASREPTNLSRQRFSANLYCANGECLRLAFSINIECIANFNFQLSSIRFQFMPIQLSCVFLCSDATRFRKQSSNMIFALFFCAISNLNSNAKENSSKKRSAIALIKFARATKEAELESEQTGLFGARVAFDV